MPENWLPCGGIDPYCFILTIYRQTLYAGIKGTKSNSMSMLLYSWDGYFGLLHVLIDFLHDTVPLTRYLETGCSGSNQTWQYLHEGSPPNIFGDDLN